MKKLFNPASALAFLLLVIAMPAAAEVYTVTLTNGSTFETRYEPLEDPSNPGKVILLTDAGNWIALPVHLISGVTANTETQGFGLVVDSNTYFLGISANDVEEEEPGQPADPMTQLLRFIEGREQQENYTVPQFAEPSEAGGIPIDFTRTVTPPIGRTGVDYSRQPVSDD